MSYQTRSSSGSWQQVAAPVDYAGVVSNYAASFINAQIAQQNRDLEEKALAYKDGTLPYKDFIDYINSQLGTVTAGSAQELNLKQALVATQDYERGQKIAIKRSDLEAKYAKDGISADEQLKIEKELLPLYKAGSADYSQQLANVSKAQDLKTQEDKNIKVAALQAKLSQGGLSTGEQIQVYNEALSMTDKNSQDYQKITGQINTLKEQKRIEDQDNAKNAAVSGLLSKYKVGGLSNDELLTINRTMQKFTDPGTPAFVNLQEEEAKLLGSIAQNGGGGGTGTGGSGGINGINKNEINAQLAVADQKMQDLEQRFQNGAISDQEYLQGKQQLLNTETGLLGQLGEGIVKDASLTKQQALLQEQSKQFEESMKLYSEGKAVTIKTPQGQAIIPIDQAQAYASQNVDVLDANGNPVKANVLTTNTGGVEKQFIVQPGGSFELLKASDTGAAPQATGFIVKSIKTAPGAVSGPLPLISPTQFGSPLQNVVQGIAAVPGQIAKGVQSVLNPVQPATPTKNSSSSNNLLSNFTQSVAPAVKNATATSLFGPVGGLISNYSSQINKAASNVGSSISNTLKPVTNTISNIGNSVVSGAKNALSSVKSFFGF